MRHLIPATIGLFCLLTTFISLPSQAHTTCDETCWANVIPPTNKAKLINWLNNKGYKANFLPEPARHQSTGPHGGVVKTYYNPVLVNDLAARRKRFSKGAAMVKELFLGGNTVAGYAVMVKTDRSPTVKAGDWLFYEAFDTNGQGAFYGKGIQLCAGCHSAGKDYLLSTFRP